MTETLNKPLDPSPVWMILHQRLGNADEFHNSLPETVYNFIAEKYYERCADENGVFFSSFVELIEHERPYGLSLSRDELKAMVGHSDKTLAAIIVDEGRTLGAHGRPAIGKGAASTFIKRGSTSRDYRILKLQRDAPEVFEKVLSGEIKIPKLLRPEPKTPYEQLEKWWGKASPAERKKFKYNHFRKEEGNA